MANKQPKIMGYMAGLYDVMSTEAMKLNPDEEVDEEPILVWRGRLIETCNRVGIPTGYYKKVVDALRTLGCIELLVRGTRGSTLTTIALKYPPTAEAYQEQIVNSGWQGLTPAVSVDTMQAQIKDLQRQLGGLPLVSMFKNIEDRLQEQQTAIEALQQQLSNNQTDSTHNKGEIDHG